MFNEGIWNTQRKTWESSDMSRTMEGDEAHYTAFLAWDAFFANRRLHYATSFEIIACLP